MSHRLLIRSTAEKDIADAALWYEEQRPGLGEEFLAEVGSAIDGVVNNPHQYRRLRRRPDIRRVLTRRFPYRVFFILNADSIVVFRVLHSARNDREWENAIVEDKS